MSDVQIGSIIHYFDKIKVAVVKLTKGDLKIGDKVKLIDVKGSEFTQKIKSMQIEHASIEIAKSGDEFGLLVEKPIRAKTKIVKVS